MGNPSAIFVPLIWILLTLSGVMAQTGSGIPRVTFPPEEVGKNIHLWTNLVGRVPKAMMFQGYLLVFQNRSGQISTFDFSNPRQPIKLGAFNAQGNGDEHVVPSTGTRIVASGSVVDYANPISPKLIGRWGQYFLSVWPAFQWPYLYNTRTYDTDGKSSPLTILDYSNPSAPKEVKSLDAISKVGFTTGTTLVVGNLLLVASGDVYAGVSAWDIADPVNPQLISVNKSGSGMYTGQLYGKHIVTTGPKNNGTTAFFDFSNPEDIHLDWQEDIAYSGDYAHFQNGFLFGSRLDQGRWIKYDIAARKTVVYGTVPAMTGNRRSPTRYCIPLGNMLFLGDPDNDATGKGDGITGVSVAGIYVHQARPDSIGPSLLFFDPPDGATHMPLTSRVGFGFDEEVDSRLLDPAHIRIASVDDGIPIQGEYGHTNGTVNFTPKEKLKPETTYEVVVGAGAVKDWTGNGNAKSYSFRFSTGANITASGIHSFAPSFWSTWRNRPRLSAQGGTDGVWKITLANWKGALPHGFFRMEFTDASGAAGSVLRVSGEDLARGVEWRPARRLSGPILMRLSLPQVEIRGLLLAR